MNRKSILSLVAAIVVSAMAALPAAAADGALALVPANAVTVGVVKLSDMRTSPLSGMLFQQTDKFSADGDAAKFLSDAGLDPAKDVDLVVVSTSPRTALGSEAEILVAAEGRFNVDRLTKALIERGAVKKGGYLLSPEKEGDQPAIAFVSSSLTLMGTEKAVAAALTARSNGGTGFPTASNLGAEMSRIDSNATAWALIDVPRAQRLTGAPRVPNSSGNHDALQAALKSVSLVALWATDAGDSLKVGAFGLSGDAETLELLEDTIRGALSAMRLAVKDKAPEMVSVLRRFDVSRTGDSVKITGSIPAATIRELATKKHSKVASN